MNARTEIFAIRSRSNLASRLDGDPEPSCVRYLPVKQPAASKHGFSISPRHTREFCLKAI
jgi:hypothetical protein